MWAVIAALVIYHEFACKKGQLLSEEYDRGLDKHPALVYGVTGVTVAHLLNWLPPEVDPYRWIFLLYTQLKGTLCR